MVVVEMKVFQYCTLIYLSLAFIAAETPEPGNVLPSHQICGTKIHPRSVNNVEQTYLGEFPWMVVLLFSEDNKGFRPFCHGVLINTRYVLTAGHCAKHSRSSLQLLSARLGEWNRSTDPDCSTISKTIRKCAPPHIDVPIEDTIVPENYRNHPIENDIALLRLKHAVDYTDHVMPICLPKASDFPTKNYTNIEMHIAGWDLSPTQSENSIKSKANVTVLDLNKCEETYSTVIFNELQLCAFGDLYPEVCKSVQAGPLMFLNETGHARNYFIIGIASFGMKNCGRGEFPDVYTRVDAYTEWIQQQLRP